MKRPEISLSEFESIVEQFPDMERAVLHGIGEPLLNAALPEMIRYLKGRQVAVLFNSNGTLLDPAWQEALALSGLDEYRLSLDAAHPAMYARIRGRPYYERVVTNIRQFVSTMARLGVETPRISLWCMAMKENIDELPDLMRLAADLGIPEVYLQRLTYEIVASERHGLGQQEQALFGNLQERESAIIQRSEQLSREWGVAFQASGATEPSHSLRGGQTADVQPWAACLRPWTTAYITANGNALPCCISPFATTLYDDLILGNVWEQGFSEIWNAEPYRRWREALLGPTPHQACTGCGVYWSL